MRTAACIKGALKHFPDAALYKLDPPYVWNDGTCLEMVGYVVVSTSIVPGSGPETLAFPANEDSIRTEDPTSFYDIAGGRGEWSHADVLRDLGYEVVPLAIDGPPEAR